MMMMGTHHFQSPTLPLIPQRLNLREAILPLCFLFAAAGSSLSILFFVFLLCGRSSSR